MNTTLKVIDVEIRPRDQREFQSPRLYFWFEAETVLDQLYSRRDTARHQLIEPLIRPTLEANSIHVQSFSYSRKAGCDCGCSPGFILNGAKHPENVEFDVYIVVGVEDFAEYRLADDGNPLAA
jgi:hypothetical protein